MREIWKDIPTFDGYYQVSDLGNVRSLDRVVTDKGRGFKRLKGRVLKPRDNKNGYRVVTLSVKGKTYTKKVHQLVAMAFLGHIPNGHKIVVNHKNFIRTDNRLSNLELITQRENADFKHLPSTSKYVGVYLRKSCKKWVAQITINGKRIYLGYFTDEYQAHLAYQKKLKEINQ